ncbi:hypothetical protein HK098_001641 [Nowakowskiella sp. JEL0407]|nr:hypothetical protein HK098_001641 [Nowakowskiella sp. JEL0407]
MNFDYDWATFTQAVWQKYPNPFASHVISSDVVDRKVDPKTGVMTTTRLFLKKGILPAWAALKIEVTMVDPKNEKMIIVQKNLSHTKLMLVEERQTIQPHSLNPRFATEVIQEGRIVSSTGWSAIKSKIEGFGISKFKDNTKKVREIIESELEEHNLTQENTSADTPRHSIPNLVFEHEEENEDPDEVLLDQDFQHGKRSKTNSNSRILETRSGNQQEIARKRKKKGLKQTVGVLKALGVFSKNKDVNKKNKNTGEEQATLKANESNSSFYSSDKIAKFIGFDVDDYKASMHQTQFAWKLSSNIRDVLAKETFDYTEHDVELLYKLTSTMPTFIKYDKQVRTALCRVIKYQSFGSDKVIVKQGHIAHSFFFILAGSVSIKKQVGDSVVDLGVLKAGESFGELALLNNVRRSATITTCEDTEFLVVHKSDFTEVLRSEAERDLDEKTKFLALIPLFKYLNKERTLGLALTAHTKEFVSGQVLVAEGDVPTHVMMIRDGSCRLLKVVQFERPKVKKMDKRLFLPALPKTKSIISTLPSFKFDEPEKAADHRSQENVNSHRELSITNHTQTKHTKKNNKNCSKVLRVCDVGRGFYFNEASALATFGTAQALRDMELTPRLIFEMRKSPFSIVANSRVQCLMINRTEFSRVCTAEMLKQIGSRVRIDFSNEDDKSILAVDKLKV